MDEKAEKLQKQMDAYNVGVAIGEYVVAVLAGLQDAGVDEALAKQLIVAGVKVGDKYEI